MNEEVKPLPHNDLRVIEAKIRDMALIAITKSDDPVWGALDRLWDYVVKGGQDA
jgi:hypothetical protein